MLPAPLNGGDVRNSISGGIIAPSHTKPLVRPGLVFLEDDPR